MSEVTFVCCIEQGRLEAQTVLMLTTLREHGGSMASAPAIAVKGRPGPALSKGTRDTLDRLGVEVVQAYRYNDAKWFNYSNKVAAVGYAQEYAKTPVAVWLDSDVLIAGEPTELALAENEDFAGRCEYLPPAIHAGVSEHVPYWRELCEILDVNFDEVPWVDLDWPRCRMKLFFNSGVFAWRRESSFARCHRAAFRAMLRSKIAMHDGNMWQAEQVILSLIVTRERLRWRHLSLQYHHMIFQHHLTGPSASPVMTASKVIHYSKSLDPPFDKSMLERLESELPAVHEAVFASRADAGVPSSRRPKSLLNFMRHARLRWFVALSHRASRG